MSDPNMTEAEHAYWEGAASRQADIDELQKRIDEALTFSTTWHKSTGSALALEIIKILKGKEND